MLDRVSTVNEEAQNIKQSFAGIDIDLKDYFDSSARISDQNSSPEPLLNQPKVQDSSDDSNSDHLELSVKDADTSPDI